MVEASERDAVVAVRGAVGVSPDRAGRIEYRFVTGPARQIVALLVP